MEQIAKKRIMGALPSPYDPRDYITQFTDGAPVGKWPESIVLPDDIPVYEQDDVGNCVVQAIRYIFQRIFGREFGRTMLYGLARPDAARGIPGLEFSTALNFACKYGLAPIEDDPYQYEVPKAYAWAQENKARLLAAAAPYAGCTYARLLTVDAIKAALADGRDFLYRMEVSKNGLNKLYWWRGDGYRGVGHHAMVGKGYELHNTTTNRPKEGTYDRNSWGDDWGKDGRCWMTWEDVLRKGDVFAIFPPEGYDKNKKPILVSRRALCKGMTGTDVKEAQTKLTAHGVPCGPIDGIFGSKTLAAVRAFQKAKNIPDPDGIVGELTWVALDAEPIPIKPTPEPTPGTVREKMLAKVFEAGAALIGSNYSQEDRYKLYPGGSFDCSIFVAGIFAAAGFPLLNSKGAELLTSNTQMDAVGFDVIYPSSATDIGKSLPSAKGLLLSLAKEGDVIGFNLKSTSRKNKVTHIAVVDKGALKIIQTANNVRKCERLPLDTYDTHVCAILRLKSDIVPPTLPAIARGSANKAMVRTLQICLNLWDGARLVCDGAYGPKTAAAVKDINASIGIDSEECTAKTWAAMGL